MNMYLSILEAMEHLLDRVGEKHWRDWIRTDIKRWNEFKDSTHHREAYGGMGSINDSILCIMNGHHINQDVEEQVTLLYDWLRTINYHNAFDPEHKRFNFTTMDELKKIIRYDNTAFNGNANDFDNLMTIYNPNQELDGWRCQNCGYSEIENKEIKYYLDACVFPAKFINACQQDTLIAFIDKVLDNKLPNIQVLIPQLKKIMKQDDINCGQTINDKNKTCPACSSNNTASCKWKMEGKRLVAV